MKGKTILRVYPCPPWKILATPNCRGLSVNQIVRILSEVEDSL